MSETNYHNGVSYSYMTTNASSGNTTKKYVIDTSRVSENNYVTNLPVKYDGGYVLSLNQSGMKIAHQKDKTKIFYNNPNDNIVYKSYKSNNNSKNFSGTSFPILFNGHISVANFEDNQFEVCGKYSSKFIKGLVISDGASSNRFLFVFEDYFILCNNNMESITQISIDDKIKNIEIGEKTSKLGIVVSGNKYTYFLHFDEKLNIIKKIKYYYSSKSITINDSNEIYSSSDTYYYILGQNAWESNISLPEYIFYDKNIILVDDENYLTINSKIGRVEKNGKYIFTKIPYSITEVENFDININRSQKIPTIFNMKESTIKNALS